jgi:hypothetical protein
MSDDMTEFGPDVPRATTYVMQYRLLGPDYLDGASVPKRRTLHVLRGDRRFPAQTADEAVEAVQEFVSRPFVNATVEVMRATKVTTATVYEDVTEAVLNGGIVDG